MNAKHESPVASSGLAFPDLLIYRGYAAPVRIEGDVYDLEVIGEIPGQLDGAYYRMAADPQYPPLLGKDIFINGDGMIHKVRFEDGHADLKTRYVKTPKFKAERVARRALFGAYRNPFTDDVSVREVDGNTANTTAFWHHGKLYALKEAARPTVIDPITLDTGEIWDFHGRLESKTFTAHPKVDPKTGEVIAFAYNTRGRSSQEIEIYWISPAGEITRTETFRAPYSFMAHDSTVSQNYITFTVYPMVSDWERIQRGEPYFHWDSSLPTMVAIIPRGEGVKAIRWYTCPFTGMQTHSFNAWEEGSVLHVDHFFTASGWLSQFPDIRGVAMKEAPPHAERWSFDLASESSTFSVRQIFDQIGEMPMIDQRFLMSRARQFYFGTHNPELGPLLEWGPKGPPFTCIGHFDEARHAMKFWYAGADSSPEEPLFVPRAADAPEGEGWLLMMVGRRRENRTDLVILDAAHIDRGPVATVKMPCRLHEGFHGTWVSAAEVDAL
jgi:carotenoid cleavage dioxygenase-like enzyme